VAIFMTPVIARIGPLTLVAETGRRRCDTHIPHMVGRPPELPPHDQRLNKGKQHADKDERRRMAR
jgi:hypothetical protein